MAVLSILDGIFFLLGAITAVAVYWAVQNRGQITSSSLLSGMIGLLLLLFALAWSLTSLDAGEGRSALWGMVLFGIPAAIFLVLAFRSMKPASR